MEKGLLMHLVGLEYDRQQSQHAGETQALNEVSSELSRGGFQMRVSHCMMIEANKNLEHGLVITDKGTPGIVLTRQQLIKLLVALEVEEKSRTPEEIN